MTYTFRNTLTFLAVAAACAPTFAQQPARSTATPTAPAASAEARRPIIETNPAVRAALEIPRKTPADYFQAITWLIELDRPELAKPILDDLAKLQLTDDQRAALVTRFGSRDMLQLARSKPLAPIGAQFADACMEAAAAAANDPKRIATLLAQLADPSAENRLMARNDLLAIGQPAVAATLEALARETNPARRAALAEAASHMQPLVVGPLLAMLETSDNDLRYLVATLLEQLAVPQAAPLVSQSPASAELRLKRAIDRYRRGTPPFAVDENNQVELWQWDDESKKLTSARYAADEARTIWMARLARELARYFPDNFAYQKQAALLELEVAALVGNNRPPVLAELQTLDLDTLNQFLASALASNYSHAAVALADELGRRRISDVLYSADGRPMPLAAALQSPNRRVRFAALRAIMTLDPQSPYPGSSRVPEALAWFAAGTGERRAVVAMTTVVRATELAGLLAAKHIAADATDNGREAVDTALATPDLEMIFVDVNINVPDIRQVLYELRISPTTAEVPIAILAPESRLTTAEQLATEHTRVVASPRVHSSEVLERLIERLDTSAGRFQVAPDIRVAEANAALGWLAQLATDQRPFYKIRRSEPAIESALYSGASSSRAAVTALRKLGTPNSQVALATFASQPTLPAAARSHAAEAFRQSVAEHGLLLTSDEILTQYDRYNASAKADVETQRILGSLLDTIETRDGLQPLPSAAEPPAPNHQPLPDELPLPF